MEKVFILAISITVLFIILKFMEMKYLENEIKPMKLLIRDIILVFSSAFACSYIVCNFDKTITEFFSVVTNTPSSFIPETTQVFTDIPAF